MTRIDDLIGKANDFKHSFDNYAYLWVDDRFEFMRQFLLYNHVLTLEDLEQIHNEGSIPENPPTLNQFKEQVMYTS